MRGVGGVRKRLVLWWAHCFSPRCSQPASARGKFSFGGVLLPVSVRALLTVSCCVLEMRTGKGEPLCSLNTSICAEAVMSASLCYNVKQSGMLDSPSCLPVLAQSFSLLCPVQIPALINVGKQPIRLLGSTWTCNTHSRMEGQLATYNEYLCYSTAQLKIAHVISTMFAETLYIEMKC